MMMKSEDFVSFLLSCLFFISFQTHVIVHGLDAATYVTSVTSGNTGALTVDLRVNEWRYESTDSTVRFHTRVYNGNRGSGNYLQPGPTIRVKPGDVLTINLYNDLGPNDDACADPTVLNTLHSPNTTNVHTHGLHVSSVSPADSVFTQVQPGASFTHVYQIPGR